jgi:inner membrane protein
MVWISGRLVGDGSRASSWRRLTLLALVGLAVHLLLDLSNDYGVRILLPFTAQWCRLDLTSLFDFWILVILAVGLLAPVWAESHGVGGPVRARLPRLAAAASLALVAGFLVALQVSHRIALQSLEALAASHRHARVACLPGSISPLRWTGVLETESRFEIYDIDVGRGVSRIRRIFPKDCDKRLEEAARRNPRVRALLSFARFPIFRAEPSTVPNGSMGHTVLVEDLRWLAPRGYVFGPCVRVWMDGDLRIVGEKAQSWR